MKVILFALIVALPVVAAPQKSQKMKTSFDKSKQNAAFCALKNVPEKFRKAHGCK